MSGKNLFRNLLLALAVGSVVYLAASEYAARRQAASETRTSASAPVGDPASADLIVYYFSQGKECATCDNIEAYAREALDRHFAEELASGRIAWRSIDVDKPRNEHFVEEYGLYTKAVVLVDVESGKQVRWKNLEDVWDLVYDKPAFIDYVRAQVQEFLAATP
jgi:hypothetical protein